MTHHCHNQVNVHIQYPLKVFGPFGLCFDCFTLLYSVCLAKALNKRSTLIKFSSASYDIVHNRHCVIQQNLPNVTETYLLKEHFLFPPPLAPGKYFCFFCFNESVRETACAF